MPVESDSVGQLLHRRAEASENGEGETTLT